MAKIVINIDMDELTSGINQVVDDEILDEMEMEDEIVCPISTQDSEVNAANREVAIQDHSYGSSEKRKEKCGVCEYYDIRALMLDCVETGIGMEEGDEVGYCTKLDFTCAAENVCNDWEKGGPITDFDDIDIYEPLEGNKKDIF
mgnify:FL=1|tara:strand:- start:1030 stop:1461 length:432 start_codon:yes stop_codon:yes gene_type:complete